MVFDFKPMGGFRGSRYFFACQVPRFLAISLHSFQHGHGAGVAYCHAKGVMHKDLKLENIMPLDFIGPGRGYGYMDAMNE